MNHSDLPSDARLAFKGVMYEIWQWDQPMFDGSTEIFECIVRNDSVDVIATVGDQILLEKQQQPDSTDFFLSFPGGRRDEKEGTLQTGQRELLEEMGYQSQKWNLWKQYQPSSSRLRFTIYTYIAHDCIKIAQPVLDAGEKIEELRVSFDEFLMLPDNPLFRNKHLEAPLLRARYDTQERAILHTLLFGSR